MSSPRSQRDHLQAQLNDAARQLRDAVVNDRLDEPVRRDSVIACIDALDQHLANAPLPRPRATWDAPATSHAAAELIRTRQHSIAVQILQSLVRVYRATGQGLTADQVQQRLKLKHQTCASRFTELRNGGWVVASDVRRKTTSGAYADVYIPTQLTLEAHALSTTETQ